MKDILNQIKLKPKNPKILGVELAKYANSSRKFEYVLHCINMDDNPYPYSENFLSGIKPHYRDTSLIGSFLNECMFYDYLRTILITEKYINYVLGYWIPKLCWYKENDIPKYEKLKSELYPLFDKHKASFFYSVGLKTQNICHDELKIFYNEKLFPEEYFRFYNYCLILNSFNKELPKHKDLIKNDFPLNPSYLDPMDYDTISRYPYTELNDFFTDSNLETYLLEFLHHRIIHTVNSELLMCEDEKSKIREIVLKLGIQSPANWENFLEYKVMFKNLTLDKKIKYLKLSESLGLPKSFSRSVLKSIFSK